MSLQIPSLGRSVGVEACQSAVVYVESNLPDQNSVLAYARGTDGTLTQIGSFPTGGKGVFDLSLQLGPFDSDQEIIVNGQHNLLFAVNPGSDTVAVFRIQADGSLVHVLVDCRSEFVTT